MKHFRELYAKIISDKHDDVMAKFGATLAQGILDAGGRNASIQMQSRTGHTNMLAVVGTLVFCQFWYWYPLAHFLSLAFTPTCLVALNADLQVTAQTAHVIHVAQLQVFIVNINVSMLRQMPKIEIRSNARPSMFAYVPPLEEKKDKKGEKVETAVLSITATRARAASTRRVARSKVTLRL